MDFYHFKKSWKGLLGQACLATLSTKAQNHPLCGHPPPIPCSRTIYLRWGDEFCQAITDNPGTAIVSCTTPTSPTLPPFIRGAIKVGNHQYSSAAFQITLCNTFDSWYSTHFRHGADDKTRCHCPRGPPHSAKHILTECPLFTFHRQLFFSNHSYQWIFSCHGQAAMSFVPTRILAFSGFLGFSGIRGSWVSEDYTSQCNLESSKVLSHDLEL